MASITCGNCKQTHTTVELVKACYAGQSDYAKASKMLSDSAERREMHPSHASNPIASKLINKAAERRMPRTIPSVGDVVGVRFAPSPEPLFEDEPDEQGNPAVVYVQATEPGESTRKANGNTKPGFYKVGNDVFKVTLARTSDRTFAHRLIAADGAAPEWEYQGLGRRFVPEYADKLTLAEAKQYGHTHGYCLICGRLLTAEQSVADGIGPICAGKL